MRRCNIAFLHQLGICHNNVTVDNIVYMYVCMYVCMCESKYLCLKFYVYVSTTVSMNQFDSALLHFVHSLIVSWFVLDPFNGKDTLPA